MYHYIYQNLFIVSDLELSSEEYPIGNSLLDYELGKYVQLNEDQIAYEESHLNASPEEVFEMHELPYMLHVRTPLDEMHDYFEREHNLVYINEEVHPCWDHRNIIYYAKCAKARNREEFTFLADGKYFKGNTDDIIDIMQLIALYYYDLGIAINLHYRYLEKHPEELGSYDYTTGFPEILHFTLQEVYDTD